MRPKVAPWTVTSEVQTVAAGGGPARIQVTAPQDGQVVLSGTITADSDPVLQGLRVQGPGDASPEPPSSRPSAEPA